MVLHFNKRVDGGYPRHQTYHIAICGGLEYLPDNTSDGTAAHIAMHLGAQFYNLTNIDGLYDKNPFEYRNAQFIPLITAHDLVQHMKKMTYQAGQHYVIDHQAIAMINKYHIPSYILHGKKLANFKRCLEGKSFKGTTIL